MTVSLIADLQWYRSPDYQKDDARAAVGILAARLPPNAVVAVAPSYVMAVLSYYGAAANARLRFVAASPEDTVSRVLVLSRLHHVSDVADLRRAFARGPQPARESRAGGFYFLWRLPQGPTSFSPR